MADPSTDLLKVDDDLLEALLAETRTEVGYADHKASLVLAALGIGFSAFLGGLYASSWEPGDLPSAGPWFWYAGAVVALVAVVAAGVAVFPRTGKTDYGENRPIYYWGQISKTGSKEQFVSSLVAHPPDAKDRTVDQLYVLSRVVSRKYWWVKASLWAALLAGVLLIAAGLFELSDDEKDSEDATSAYVIFHR